VFPGYPKHCGFAAGFFNPPDCRESEKFVVYRVSAGPFFQTVSKAVE
jgi:hypothetical protein